MGLSIIFAVVSLVFLVLYALNAYQYAMHVMFFTMTLGHFFRSCAEYRKDSPSSKRFVAFFSVLIVAYVLVMALILK